MSVNSIKAFSKQYKGSDEEKDDVLAAYEKYKGNMSALYQTVMLSNVLEDDERFRGWIDEAIAKGDVKAFKKYTTESAAKRSARKQEATAEAGEAEEYAKELGVHEKLFGGEKAVGAASKGKGKGKAGKSKEKGGEDALAALIKGRQKERGEAFLDQLSEKYGASASSKKGKKSKKNAVEDKDEDEPDEAAFQAAAARLGSGKNKATDDAAPQPRKRSKR